jgi:hypothetical protein
VNEVKKKINIHLCVCLRMVMSITLSYHMGLRSEFRVVKSAAIYAFTSYLQLFAGGLVFLFIMDI